MIGLNRNGVVNENFSFYDVIYSLSGDPQRMNLLLRFEKGIRNWLCTISTKGFKHQMIEFEKRPTLLCF